jgi:hypothetical protein
MIFTAHPYTSLAGALSYYEIGVSHNNPKLYYILGNKIA